MLDDVVVKHDVIKLDMILCMYRTYQIIMIVSVIHDHTLSYITIVYYRLRRAGSGRWRTWSWPWTAAFRGRPVVYKQLL